MVAVGAVLAVAFSITQDAVMTIWNVALGIVVMLWAFGFGTMKELLSSNRRKRRCLRPVRHTHRNERRGSEA